MPWPHPITTKRNRFESRTSRCASALGIEGLTVIQKSALTDDRPAGAVKREHRDIEEGDTVYVMTAAAEGRMVSYIQSNYQGFGSGVVVPGTSISLQDRGAGVTLQPGHPTRSARGNAPPTPTRRAGPSCPAVVLRSRRG